ncbi:MAG: flagellar motor switch protein FliM, partial [Candidatus Marinimicrobia bacterium]|nr:flagellar motor switch protein FliM [Candidatus Neomarinimicrobiota bacterium]
MTKLLSQKEIDALLTKDNISDTGIMSAGSQKMVSVYDFRHPDRVSKDQMRALRTIHERFGRMFATYLSSNLRMMVDIKVDSIDQVTYSEYAMSLTTPACIYVIEFENLGGSGLIELSSDLFFILLDRQLGGSGKSSIESREVTIIEQKVLEKVLIAALTFLNDAWQLITPLGSRLKSFETNAQFVQIAPPSETVVIIILD